MNSKRIFHWLGLFTLIGFSLAGWFIIEFIQGRSISDVFHQQYKSYGQQALQGFFFGIVASMNILWLLYNSLLKTPRTVFSELISRFRLNLLDMVFLSFCAGVGEEILFRGAIQWWLGIWPTAILFILLHGYLNPFDWKMSIYGLLMVVIVAGLGYLFERVGLVAAITAHFIIDVAIFVSLRYFNNLRPDEEHKEPD